MKVLCLVDGRIIIKLLYVFELTGEGDNQRN